ncbi:hypothetical protein LCGC14_2816590 [marine sediment metagenome]|uniref:Uncharacterized protein n=1 Tax=marine sediment metagenome TaxID=412755 RepID=A0A0F8YIA3_9ZZZZ
MKVFPHMNTSGPEVCPVCKTKDDKPVVLIGIDGTENGGNIQAKQIHLDCINLRCYEVDNKLIIYMLVGAV